MSVDFEERLREEFAAVPLEIQVDADATLAAGRRARSRRVGAAIGTVALVAAVALVAVPFLRGRSIPAVPEPVQAPATSATAVFDHAVHNGGDETPGIESGTVSVERVTSGVGQRFKVAVTLTTVQGERLSRTFERKDGQPWDVFKINDYAFVAILTTTPRWEQIVTERGGVWAFDSRPLAGMQLTALLAVASSPPGSLTGVIWEESDGLTRNSLGQDVSAVTFSENGLDETVYADAGLDEIGIQYDGGGSSKPLSQVGTDYVAIGLSASSTADRWAARALFLLPPGARDPDVRVKGLAGTVTWASDVLVGGALDGRRVVLIHATPPAGAEPAGVATMVDTLSFTNSEGVRETVHPHD